MRRRRLSLSYSPRPRGQPVILACGLLAAGWALGLFSGVLKVRRTPPGEQVQWGGISIDWASFSPYLLGLMLCMACGVELQKTPIGYWAVLVALGPLFLFSTFPIWLHRRRSQHPRPARD